MKEAKDFIQKFRVLEGTLLKEKKKSLFLLLEAHKSLRGNKKALEKIDKDLTPITYLEEIYKVEILIFFRRASSLFDILKTGNDIAASKIIRQTWFLKQILHKMPPKEFVQNVFPQLSIVIRAKILKQILKEFKDDEEFINDLFNELLQTYGLKPALVLLVGCSVNKIKEILINRGLNLSKPQLKLLHDKDPSLITFYYEEFYRKGGDMNHLNTFSVYLSKKDANLYVQLLLKYKFREDRLGRQTTRKYIAENKENVLKEPQKYLDFRLFEEHALVRELGNEFPIFLKALFPTQLSALMNSKVHSLLDHYPKKKRYELYSNTFHDVYKESLFNNRAFMTDKLLEVIPNEEEKEKWVEKFENRVEYIKYKRSSLAIAELKEQLFRCDDIKLRVELFRYIVTSCSINADYDALLDILKLFCSRFRNTTSSVIYDFLSVIYEKIELEKLNEEHWGCIHEIILIQNIRNLSLNALIIFEYTRYLYKSGKSFEEMILIFLKTNNFTLTSLQFKNDKFRDERFQRQFLEFVLKYYSEVNEVKENVYKTTEIVLAIRNWNKCHPDDIIVVSEQKDIVEAIKKAVNVGWVYHMSDEVTSMKYLVCRENISEEFIEIYFDQLDSLKNVTMNKWFLKYKPCVFKEKIDKVVKCFNTRYSLMKFLKKYEHNGLVDSITDYYLEKLKNPNLNEEDIEKVVVLLASIMPKTNFLKLLQDYVPTIDKLDVGRCTEEERKSLQIQIALAKSVRFATCHADALPILLKYCRGDCFQPALYSLYKCFNRIPEDTLKPLLDTLLENSVSVRKHTIFLAAMAFPIEINENLGKKIMVSDKNDSIQKHLFTSSYKYFLKNPLEPFWNILKKYMCHLTWHEKESLKLLTDVHAIPEKYRDKFTKRVLKVFSELEKKEKKPMNEYYDKLMENVTDDDIRYLSNDLCTNIIRTKFFKEDYKANSACMNFAIKFMMYGDDTRTNIQVVLNLLEEYKTKYWNSSEVSVFAKSVIRNFCTRIFLKSMQKRQLRMYLRNEFVVILSEEWKKLFTLQDTFEEYLMMDFMVLKYEECKDLAFYANKISNSFKNLRNTYGDLIVGLFKNFLSDSLKYLLGDKNFIMKLMKLITIILKEDSSLPCCLLLIQLLPSYQADEEFRTNFEYVMKELKNKDEIVQIYLNTYIKEQTYFLEITE